ncbi:hypothetical protein [Dyadobacter bucti]|uniref:hypothetical protein n=1 Tax=Dyadobacter bucti TaxID=2572203 RepID=UPI001109D287|nr:hypothetical protein [Dyadobacter bucti]
MEENKSNSSVDVMKRIDDFFKKLNPVEKKVATFIPPIILFIVFYKLAESYDEERFWPGSGDAFDMADTWWVWIIYLLIIGFLLLKIHNQPDTKS